MDQALQFLLLPPPLISVVFVGNSVQSLGVGWCSCSSCSSSSSSSSCLNDGLCPLQGLPHLGPVEVPVALSHRHGNLGRALTEELGSCRRRDIGKFYGNAFVGISILYLGLSSPGILSRGPSCRGIPTRGPSCPEIQTLDVNGKKIN